MSKRPQQTVIVQRNFQFLTDLVLCRYILFHLMLCFVSLNLDSIGIDINNFSYVVFLKFLPFSCRSCCMFYTYLFVCLSTYPSIVSCIYSFVRSFVRLFVCSHIYLFCTRLEFLRWIKRRNENDESILCYFS